MITSSFSVHSHTLTTSDSSINILFHDHRWLVYRVLKQHFSSIEHLKEDLIQEGYLALWNAANNYVNNKGSFINYAYMAIRRSMDWHVNRQYASTCIAINVSRKIHDIHRFKHYFKGKKCRFPTTEEIARFFETNIQHVEQMETLESTQHPHSINEVLQEETHFCIHDVLSDGTQDAFFDRIDAAMVYSKGQKIISKSRNPKRERSLKIYSLRFGNKSTEDSLSLEEIGKLFGITKERVRQLEKDIIESIKEQIAS